MVDIRPLQDRIIVRRIDERKSAGGIVIPDTSTDKPSRGEVIFVGPGKMTDDGKRIAPDIKKGDQVLFGKYSGTEIELKGEKLLVMREDDVLAVIAE